MILVSQLVCAHFLGALGIAGPDLCAMPVVLVGFANPAFGGCSWLVVALRAFFLRACACVPPGVLVGRG